LQLVRGFLADMILEVQPRMILANMLAGLECYLRVDAAAILCSANPEEIQFEAEQGLAGYNAGPKLAPRLSPLQLVGFCLIIENLQRFTSRPTPKLPFHPTELAELLQG